MKKNDVTQKEIVGVGLRRCRRRGTGRRPDACWYGKKLEKQEARV